MALNDYARGAELATALIGTAPRVWRGTEKLAAVADLEALLSAHGFAATCTARDLTAVRSQRARLWTIVDAALGGEPAGELARRASRLVTGGLTLSPDERDWVFVAEGGLAAQVAAVAAVGMLGTIRALGTERFRPCAASFCAGAFIDASRAGRRRYCLPGICGNRVNVANHRARQRNTGS
ncbi:CGNR zinc finger domain-containing protein [Nocardia blacklockiae]|nr:CGNR zinc finger domain-containing protein [Nocardia blacklockiae]